MWAASAEGGGLSMENVRCRNGPSAGGQPFGANSSGNTSRHAPCFSGSNSASRKYSQFVQDTSLIADYDIESFCKRQASRRAHRWLTAVGSTLSGVVFFYSGDVDLPMGRSIYQ